jgi:hypothetical protein
LELYAGASVTQKSENGDLETRFSTRASTGQDEENCDLEYKVYKFELANEWQTASVDSASAFWKSRDNLNMGDLIMTTRLVASRWTMLAIFFSIVLLGIKGLGILAAGAREPDQGQDTTTGSVKAVEEYRSLVKEIKDLRELAQSQRAQLQNTEAALARAQASVQRPDLKDQGRRELQALMEQIRGSEEDLRHMEEHLASSASTRPGVKANDPAMVSVQRHLGKLREKYKQLSFANESNEPATVPSQSPGRYQGSVGGSNPTVLVIDTLTGRCWTHTIGGSAGDWADLGSPAPSKK